MHIKKIIELRPVDATAAAIGQSLVEAQDALNATVQRLSDLQESRGAVLVRGSAEDVDAHTKLMRELERDIVDLEGFIVALRPELDTARHDEKVAALRARYYEFAQDDATAAWVKEWNEIYLPAASKIAALLPREKELTESRRKANNVGNQLAALGVDVPLVVSPGHLAAGGPIAGYETFGAMIRLPGALGAPAIPQRMWTNRTTRTVTKPDWGNVTRGVSETGKPHATVEIEETVSEQMSEPSRIDDAVWWPKSSA